MQNNKKILRISTVPISLDLLLEGQLKMLSKYYDVVGVSSSGKELQKVSIREGIRVIPLDMERRISPIKDLISLYKLIIIIKAERPWMVHSLTPKAGLLSMIAAYICRVPFRIHTFTGLIFPNSKGIKKLLLMLTDKITCFCATKINPEGKGIMNDLLSLNISLDKISIIGNGNVNGINIDYYKRNEVIMESAKKISNKGYITFCFVGRLVKDKGINELINAFKCLESTEKKIRLFLVGEFETELDPLKKETLDLINNDNRIKTFGWQNDVRPFLAASDIFVFPSYREGFPNVLLQAGCMGLPSIVTNINGSNEIIISGINGIIIPPKDEKALYKTMNYLIQHNNIVDYMSRNARECIVSRYEQKYLWSELLKFYNGLENEIQ